MTLSKNTVDLRNLAIIPSLCYLLSFMTSLFAHLGFIRERERVFFFWERGGVWEVDKGQQICQQNTATEDMGRSDKRAPALLTKQKTDLTFSRRSFV